MRPAVVAVSVGLAVAIAVPATWSLTRPSTTAGAPVDQVLAVSPPAAPSSSGTAASGAGPLPPVTTRPAAPTQTAVPAPVRLVVPALGVDAPVDAVGVEPDGQMTLPEDVARVGWYRFGPAPGSDGSAVIAGHVDDAEQGLGAIAPLGEAAVGTEVQVTDAAGTTTTWRVVSRELITKQALPVDTLFRRDGPPRLTLITCGGPFLPEYRSYRDNVVVVAEPVR